MAQLYLQQGHRKEALEVYRQLVILRPHDKSLRDKVAELELPPLAAPSEPRIRTAREFFAAFATRVPGAPIAPPAPVVVASPPPPVAAAVEAPPPLPPPPEPPAVVAEPIATAVPAAPEIPPPPPPAPTPTVVEPTPLDVDAFVPETYDPGVAEIDAAALENESYSVDEYGASSLGAATTNDQRSRDFEYDQTMDLDDLSGSNEYHDTSYTFEPTVSSPSGASSAPADLPPAEQHANDARPAAPPPAPTPARRPQTGSVSVLFPGMAVPGVDEAAAATLAGAFGGTSASQPIAVPVPAVRPAPSELSLDSIFAGDEVAVEAEQFTSWLAGLKKK